MPAAKDEEEGSGSDANLPLKFCELPDFVTVGTYIPPQSPIYSKIKNENNTSPHHQQQHPSQHHPQQHPQHQVQAVAPVQDIHVSPAGYPQGNSPYQQSAYPMQPVPNYSNGYYQTASPIPPQSYHQDHVK